MLIAVMLAATRIESFAPPIRMPVSGLSSAAVGQGAGDCTIRLEIDLNRVERTRVRGYRPRLSLSSIGIYTTLP